MITAFCVKCRTKRGMLNTQKVTLKNGRAATKGTCPICNTQMFRLGS